MDIQDLEHLIKERRSIRRWKKKEVPLDLVMKAIELATWAPNGGNFQPWHFIVAKNPKLIEKLAEPVQSTIAKIASWPEAKPWEEEVKQYRQGAYFFKDAPMCVGVFLRRYESLWNKILAAREPVDPKAKQILSYRRSAASGIQSIGAAVTLMLLAFHQMGLGAVWMCAPLVAKKEIEAMLEAPSDMNLVCLVAVGYPDESPQVDRKPVQEVVQIRS